MSGDGLGEGRASGVRAARLCCLWKFMKLYLIIGALFHIQAVLQLKSAKSHLLDIKNKQTERRQRWARTVLASGALLAAVPGGVQARARSCTAALRG